MNCAYMILLMAEVLHHLGCPLDDELQRSCETDILHFVGMGG